MADKKEKKGAKGKGTTDKGKPETKVEEPKEPEIPDGPRTYVVGGWSSIAAISEATRIADPAIGDRVAVKAGMFDECVEIAKEGLHLKGVGNREAITLKKGVKASATTCSLSGVTVIGEVEVEKGNLALSDCAVAKGKHGVIIHATANPSIKNNTITDQTIAAVYAFPRSRGTVEGNQLVGTGAEQTVGVFADDSSTVFKKNTISQQVTGITVQGQCAGLLLQANNISDIGGTGIHFTKGAAATCKANTVESCKYYGVLVEQAASPTLEKNTVSACPVAIKSGCKPVLKHNQFTGRLENANEIVNEKLEPTY
jgi:hypothetical protein|uniref:Right handed beta helix domain-containing protein n=1 Tax=Eutreptiella gymnastica TaxID=73025 RepID=A0A7S4CIN6_9EUGL|mmetsp:Transcript_25443/g.43404  ORF Transcript_25443/g.43404 Transcript_25443/m.43404 type:complete len:312 (+) Transcript_25443:73-1008(+)|eukprot:CAMPEP_0174294528 /NCGR_PEP_ID=MMETSP0809-20121228/41924_1 /TAXON_ID=73025 ORGANISM="Eutreptiella gymnastica-like, Strain CCMP1594" /NCGR_SAMPLE_ID=MMETSP0809 /ASSEMBLY_ACC=CAM_ASM_000658 /LENGTH=311 /DNA_ID=CAMNT_0015396057 /DNA_START=73 /DNA_END=1008 /DNA_ORIENTATION=-